VILWGGLKGNGTGFLELQWSGSSEAQRLMPFFYFETRLNTHWASVGISCRCWGPADRHREATHLMSPHTHVLRNKWIWSFISQCFTHPHLKLRRWLSECLYFVSHEDILWQTW
jgi:hypothetical protein